MNIANLLRRAGSVMADHPATIVGTRVVATYGELSRRVASIAGGLWSQYGLLPGDRVAIAMKNSPEYIEALFACWHAGLVAVPINAKLHSREFAYIFDDSGAQVVFVSAELFETVGEAIGLSQTPPRVIYIESKNWHALGTSAELPIHTAQADDLAWLFYTSGTTGKPKGAMLSHRNLLAMTTTYFVDVDPVQPSDRLLHAAPMSHGSGLYILPFVAGMATNVIPESGRFEPMEMFDLIAAHPGTNFFAAPTMLSRLVSAAASTPVDTRNLKTIIYGGGPMYLEDCKQAIELFGAKLVQIYGQGESPMTITSLPRRYFTDSDHPRYEQRLASVGFPQSSVDVCVVDEDGAPLPNGEIGEIVVRGDTVMSGYWNNPQATASTLRAGWLYTGDMGAFDEDGFLTLKDRTKDVIISGGTNIYPREIEEVLLLHPGVIEVSIIGRVHSDWGEEVVAFVVARDGVSVTAEVLDELCNQHIARFKRPKEYRFVQTLPKNNYGKVLKTELREWAKATVDKLASNNA